MVKFENKNIKEILEMLQNEGNDSYVMNVAPYFLQHKLHQELFDDQEKKHKELKELQAKYNDKQLFWSRCLALATWALVIATICLIKN